MRKRLVDSYTDPATSITYGLRGSPVDFSLSQQYTHDHVNAAVRDFLMKGAGTAVVEGFDYALAGALSLSIAAGRAYDAAGLFYETITTPPGGPTVVTLEAADPANPRIDLVYVQLEAGVQAVPLTRTFRRLLTEAEVLAGHAPYPPQPIERFAEEHAKATVRVRKGTPGAVPVAPALGANEAPLFHVRVNAGAATLAGGNVTDVRNKTRSLATALALLDALNASPAFTNLNESIDDRVAVLVADSSSLTRTYDDGGNLLTLDVDTAWMDERVDDRVSALVTPGSFLTKSYNDGGNLLTLALDLAGLDARYVNTTGNESMTGQLKIGGGGTDPYGGQKSSLHAVNSSGGGATAVYGYAEAGVANGDVAYGGFFHANANRASAVGGTVSYGIYAETSGGATRWAGYFNGNVHVAGALSVSGSIAKGSGTFLIDDPLAPATKDLVHGFVESNEYLLIYRVTINMGGSVTAEVNLDTALGLPAGTLQQIAAELDVYGLHSSAALNSYEATIAPDGANMVLTVNSTDETDTALVKVLICGRRNDPYIATDPWVDPATRKLVPQQTKRALTPSETAMLAVTQIPVEAGDERAGTGGVRLLTNLVGKTGYPRYPAVTEGGVIPEHPVVYVAPGQTLAGPLDVHDGVNALGGGVAWNLVDDSFLLGDGTARIAIGAGQGQSAESKVLLVTNTASSLPAGATITSIVAHVRRRQTGGDDGSSVSDNGVWLVVGGAVLPATGKAAGVWSKNVFEVIAYTFSGPDVEGLTPEDVDAGLGFGVQVTFSDPNENEDVEAEFDQPRLTIFYEE